MKLLWIGTSRLEQCASSALLGGLWCLIRISSLKCNSELFLVYYRSSHFCCIIDVSFFFQGDAEQSTLIVVLNCMDPFLVVALKTAVSTGKIVLISLDEGDAETAGDQKEFLSKLLRKEFQPSDSEEDSDNMCLLLSDQSTMPVHPNLQIYLTIRGTIKSVIKPDGSMALSPFLSSLSLHDALQFVDMELKKKALENSMQEFVLSKERPEYQITHRSLLADLTLHEQELEVQQGKMLEYTLDPKNSNLLLAEDLMSMVSKTESAEVAASDQVREATKNLRVSDQLVLPYKPFSHWASVVLSNIQKVSSALRYFTFSVGEFQTILSEVIYEFKGVKVADHTMSIKGHVIHLKNELLLRVYQKLQVCRIVLFIFINELLTPIFRCACLSSTRFWFLC